MFSSIILEQSKLDNDSGHFEVIWEKDLAAPHKLYIF